MSCRKSTILPGDGTSGDGVLVGKKVRLRRKRLSDARDDYRWQSDPELAQLDAAPVLRASFPAYLLDYTEQLHAQGRTRQPFAIDTPEGEHIGNCTLYDIDLKKREAQLGIMIGDRRYWNRGYGADAVATMVDHVFRDCDLNRVYLKTLAWNVRAQRSFAKSGFVPCGHLTRYGQNFILMEVRREKWLERQPAGETSDA